MGIFEKTQLLSKDEIKKMITRFYTTAFESESIVMACNIKNIIQNLSDENVVLLISDSILVQSIAALKS